MQIHSIQLVLAILLAVIFFYRVEKSRIYRARKNARRAFSEFREICDAFFVSHSDRAMHSLALKSRLLSDIAATDDEVVVATRMLLGATMCTPDADAADVDVIKAYAEKALALLHYVRHLNSAFERRFAIFIPKNKFHGAAKTSSALFAKFAMRYRLFS